jgi:hypothetical protein
MGCIMITTKGIDIELMPSKEKPNHQLDHTNNSAFFPSFASAWIFIDTEATAKTRIDIGAVPMPNIFCG